MATTGITGNTGLWAVERTGSLGSPKSLSGRRGRGDLAEDGLCSLRPPLRRVLHDGLAERRADEARCELARRVAGVQEWVDLDELQAAKGTGVGQDLHRQVGLAV